MLIGFLIKLKLLILIIMNELYFHVIDGLVKNMMIIKFNVIYYQYMNNQSVIYFIFLYLGNGLHEHDQKNKHFFFALVFRNKNAKKKNIYIGGLRSIYMCAFVYVLIFCLIIYASSVFLFFCFFVSLFLT
jgi:hypothetical protein